MAIKTDDFTEELTAEDEAKLVELSTAAEPPPASSEGEDGAAPAAAAPAEGEATKPEGEAAATTDVNAEADEGAKDDFAAFAAKHKDRSPEDLLKLAFQKEKARRSSAYDAKEARAVVTGLRDGIQQRMAGLAAKQDAEKKAFKEKLATDPDAAVEEAFDRQQTRERTEVEEAEFNHYVAQQTEICDQAIPRFREVAPEMMNFGIQRLGYDEGQIRNAHDSRDMIALYMASRFDRLVQAGVVDFEGRVLGAGAAPAAAAPAGGQGRPARQAPTTLSGAPGNGGGAAKSLKDQAQDLLNMSDEDFEKAAAGGVLDTTLRSLTGGGQ